MSGSLLSRVSTPPPSSDLTPLQSQVDAQVGGFVQQATDWKSLAALTAGGAAYRLGKAGALSAKALAPLSVGLGLGAEVSAFELAHRGLSSENSNRWRWSGSAGLKQGLLSSLVTFSTLKGFGRLTQGQNIVLQHGAQDTAMVLGHQLIYRAGIGPKPEGTLAEQFLHAEAVNWQLKGGMALAHGFAPGIHAFERGLDLALKSDSAGAGFARPRILSSGEGEETSPLQTTSRWAFAGAGISPFSFSSTPKGLRPSLNLPMLTLGGNSHRTDYPHVQETTVEMLNGKMSVTLKIFSRKPIQKVDQAAKELSDSFLYLLRSGNSSFLKGPIVSLLQSNTSYRWFFLDQHMREFELQVDWEKRQILNLLTYKNGIRVEYSAPADFFTSGPSSTLSAWEMANILSKPIEISMLSKRAENILAWHGIEYIGQLVQKTPADLKKAPGAGRVTVSEIKAFLKEMGLSLGMQVDWQPPKLVKDVPILLDLGIFPPLMAPLLEMGIDTVEKLVERTESDLILLCDGIDPKTVRKIKERLAEMGLSLKQNPQEIDFSTRSKPEKTPKESPASTMILEFELPYAFDSAAFNLRALDRLEPAWEKTQYAGMKLLQKMGKEFKTNSEETNEEKKRRISEILDQAHRDLLKAVLSDRVREGAVPQQVEQSILGIDERLEAALAEVKNP